MHICPESCPGEKFLNGAKFGWKTKALNSSNSRKSGANLRNADKYAPHSNILPLFRTPDKLEKCFSMVQEKGQIYTDRSGL